MAVKLLHRTRPLLLLIMLSILVAGCGSGSSGTKTGVGVTGNTINLGILSPLSGTIGQLIGEPLTRGVEVFFDGINARGGIDGYKVKFIEKDSKYDPATQVQQYLAIHNQVLMIAESLGTAPTYAIESQSASDHMLLSAATLASTLARKQYMILLGTPYRLQVENAFDYLVNTKHVQNPTTAILYQDDEYGQDGLTGYTESISAYHLNNVAEVSFVQGSTDYTAQITRLKASGAKYVFLTSTPGDTAVILGTAHALGFDPQWILQSPAFANFLLTTQVAPLLQAECWVVGQGAAWGDTSIPGMKQMLADIAKYAPSQQPDGFFEFGYTESLITYAILKKAADSGDLTRDGLINAFEHIGTVNLMGLYPNAVYGSGLGNQRVPTRDNTIYAIDPTVPGGVKAISPDFTGTAAMASQF
jgi:ABC-type branched-subunit amino acid transport system substrate-binding protein